MMSSKNKKGLINTWLFVSQLEFELVDVYQIKGLKIPKRRLVLILVFIASTVFKLGTIKWSKTNIWYNLTILLKSKHINVFNILYYISILNYFQTWIDFRDKDLKISGVRGLKHAFFDVQTISWLLVSESLWNCITRWYTIYHQRKSGIDF